MTFFFHLVTEGNFNLSSFAFLRTVHQLDVDKESNPVSRAIFLFLVIAMKYILELYRRKLMSIRLLHLSYVKSNNKAHLMIFRIFTFYQQSRYIVVLFHTQKNP